MNLANKIILQVRVPEIARLHVGFSSHLSERNGLNFCKFGNYLNYKKSGTQGTRYFVSSNYIQS